MPHISLRVGAFLFLLSPGYMRNSKPFFRVDTINATGTLELLFGKAQTGDEQAIDDFFYEALEEVTLAQGIDISSLLDMISWFED